MERLPLAVKDLSNCDLYPQSLKHNLNGRFVLFVEMVSMSYLLLWHGETGHLVRLWSLFGHQMENTRLENVLQRQVEKRNQEDEGEKWRVEMEPREEARRQVKP